MLKVGSGRLPQPHREKLAEYQAEVDAEPTYQERVMAAKRLFRSRNRRRNTTFATVRASLSAMCHGPRRCMYCEDSAADEVEHFRPKDLYPEFVFAWMNYLYACGPCNRRKKNHFVLIDSATGAIRDVTRPLRGVVAPPPAGDAVLIDPRREDPLDFLILDLRDTFEFTPKSDAGALDQERADRTIDLLGLNDRDYLVAARKTAFANYYDLLSGYLRDGDPERRRVRREAIRGNSHSTVWWEMKRQRTKWKVLQNLFQGAPELLRV